MRLYDRGCRHVGASHANARRCRSRMAGWMRVRVAVDAGAPALLDGCLQVAMALVLVRAAAAAIPTALGAVRLDGAAPAEVWVHARSRGDATEVTIFDDTGRVVGELAGLQCVAMAGAATSTRRKTISPASVRRATAFRANASPTLQLACTHKFSTSSRIRVNASCSRSRSGRAKTKTTSSRNRTASAAP